MPATPTLTFRVSEELQQKATKKARRLGIPLTVVLRQALVRFLQEERFSFSSEVEIGEMEILPTPPHIQKQMGKTMDLMHKAIEKRLAGTAKT